MIYLGFDVAKNSHVAAAMSSEGEVLLMPFSFANSAGLPQTAAMPTTDNRMRDQM